MPLMSAGHTPHGSGQRIIDTKRHFRNVYNSVSELLAKSSAVKRYCFWVTLGVLSKAHKVALSEEDGRIMTTGLRGRWRTMWLAV